MKRNILFASLMLIVIVGAFYYGNAPKVEEETSVIEMAEVNGRSGADKISSWESTDGMRLYSYKDPLEGAFEKAKQENPNLAAKVEQWDILYRELARKTKDYAQVVNLYSGYHQAASTQLNQLNDSTQMLALHALVLSLDQQTELQLAVARIKAIEVERKKLDDYLIALKIESTLPYFENAVSFKADEAAQFEAFQSKIEGFLAN